MITPAQLDRLLALGGVAGTPDGTADGTPDGAEARPGLGVVHVAYWVGAGLVLFAFGWFLVDFWRVLGPAGVLAVAAAYAALFLALGARLAREGFRVAAGVARLLAVGTAPLAAWAAQEWLFPLDPAVRAACAPGRDAFFACATRWVVVELAAVLAALVAMRRTRFAPLALPPAVALAFLSHHVLVAADGGSGWHRGGGWKQLAAGALLLALAYAVDRREVATRVGGPLDDDHAAWLFLPALVVGGTALADVWSLYPELRHLLPLVALALAAGALRLRRRLLLAAAGAALLWYLGWLAFDVFRHAVAFPLLLAAFGVLVIALAVAVQRAAPRLVRERPRALGDSPAAWAVLLAPVALALLLAPDARARDRDARANSLVMQRRHQMHHKTLERERLRRAADSAAAAGAARPRPEHPRPEHPRPEPPRPERPAETRPRPEA